MASRARPRCAAPLARVFAFALPLAWGCGGTSIGNPPGATVELGVVGTVGPAPLSLDVGAGTVIDEAWVALRQIDLLESGTCSAEGDHAYDAPQPIAAELVTGTVVPAAPVWARTPDATYCELRATLDPLADAIEGAPPELVGDAVYLHGSRSDGTPFDARIDVGERLALGPVDGAFSLGGAGEAGIVLAFDLGSWLDPKLLEDAATTDGTIVIAGEDNQDLVESLEGRVPESASLYRDGNRDGLIGADGDDEPLDD